MLKEVLAAFQNSLMECKTTVDFKNKKNEIKDLCGLIYAHQLLLFKSCGSEIEKETAQLKLRNSLFEANSIVLDYFKTFSNIEALESHEKMLGDDMKAILKFVENELPKFQPPSSQLPLQPP